MPEALTFSTTLGLTLIFGGPLSPWRTPSRWRGLCPSHGCPDVYADLVGLDDCPGKGRMILYQRVCAHGLSYGQNTPTRHWLEGGRTGLSEHAPYGGLPVRGLAAAGHTGHATSPGQVMVRTWSRVRTTRCASSPVPRRNSRRGANSSTMSHSPYWRAFSR